MDSRDYLAVGIYNWKLRLILSALLCIMGLSGLISMVLGLFVDLSVYDKSIVAIAICMVGIPAYLIISKLGKVDKYMIASFLNENFKKINGKAEILMKNDDELTEGDLSLKHEMQHYFDEHPLHTFLPDRPIKQAYILMLICMLVSFGIWYLD